MWLNRPLTSLHLPELQISISLPSPPMSLWATHPLWATVASAAGWRPEVTIGKWSKKNRSTLPSTWLQPQEIEMKRLKRDRPIVPYLEAQQFLNSSNLVLIHLYGYIKPDSFGFQSDLRPWHQTWLGKILGSSMGKHVKKPWTSKGMSLTPCQNVHVYLKSLEPMNL